MAIDINNYVGAASDTRIHVPTHVSPAGGQVVHPSVIKFDTPWNGYEYWMGITPYPGGNDAHEDPIIVASHDGVNWEVPEGLTNPLDNAPGSPGAFNSDINLFYRADEATLYCFWRTTDRSLASNQEKLYYRTSTNGVTWTAKALVMQVTRTGDLSLLSPKFIWTGSDWQMWVVDDEPNPRILRRYTSTGSTPTSWGSPVSCTITNIPEDLDLWHFDFHIVDGEYLGIGAFNPVNYTGFPVSVRLMSSPDGLAWTVADQDLIPQSGQWQDTLYKSDFIPLIDSWGNVDLDVFYSAVLTGPPLVFNLMRTRVSHINDVIPPTAPSDLLVYESGIAGREIAWSPSQDDRGVSAYRVERDSVVVGTTSGSELTFTDLGSPLMESVTYRVAAVDQAGNTTWSDPFVAPPIAITPPEQAPPFEPGTAIEVRILGKGNTDGQRAAVSDYSITEDATALSLVGSQGGVGEMSTSVLEEDDPFGGSQLLRNQAFEIYDPDAGVQRGVIDSLVADDGTLHINGYSGALTLVATKTALAYSGSLSGAFYYYFAIGGVTFGIDMPPTLDGINVSLPPWTAVVWDQIRTLATIHGLEVANIAGVYTIRPIRGDRTIDVTTFASAPSLSYGAGEAAERVVVEYRAKHWEGNGLAYPDMNESILDRQVFTVNAGELLETNLPVKAHLTSIEQPTHVQFANQFAPPVSQYSVIDKDGNPVTPFAWANSGGYVKVAIGEDGESIDLTIQGSYTQSRAPYRIAAIPGGTSYAFGALYIRGAGVFFEEKEIWAYTGADPAIAPVDSEVRINEPLISNGEQAYRMLSAAAMERAGFYSRIDVDAVTVNRRGTLGIRMSMTFDDFEALYPDETFDDFEALYPDESFNEFEDEVTLDDRTLFDNQAFGGIGGARMRYRDTIYRIDAASASPGGFQWSGSADTLFDDFEASDLDEMTFDDFEALWPTQSFDDFDISPLTQG